MTGTGCGRLAGRVRLRTRWAAGMTQGHGRGLAICVQVTIANLLLRTVPSRCFQPSVLPLSHKHNTTREFQMFPSLLVSAHGPQAGIASLLPRTAPTPAPAAPVDDPFYDPALDRGRKTDKRRKVGFNFVQEGSFQKEAELFRCGDTDVCVS